MAFVDTMTPDGEVLLLPHTDAPVRLGAPLAEPARARNVTRGPLAPLVTGVSVRLATPLEVSPEGNFFLAPLGSVGRTGHVAIPWNGQTPFHGLESHLVAHLTWPRRLFRTGHRPPWRLSRWQLAP